VPRELQTMTALYYALITFVCTSAAALLGINVRAKLPETHLNKESQDVIRLGMGLVATMTALLLGLVTATAKGSFDAQDVAVKNAAAGILTLDRLLARYGPETQPSRELLKKAVADRLEAMWPPHGARPADLDTSRPSAEPAPAEQFENQILQLSPQTDTQRWIKSEALKLTEEVVRTRFRLLGSATGAVPKALLIVVIFWLSMTFGSFGLTAPRNATVVTVLMISAFSVAAAVFLILELDGPFEGLIRISSDPLRYVLANLGR
jgi:hypothetical protein